MAQVEILLPSMGESVAEATVTKWMVSEGDVVEQDDTIVEIATDKVDSEVPAPQNGTIVKVLCAEGDVVQVGAPIAIIEVEGAGSPAPSAPKAEATPEVAKVANTIEATVTAAVETANVTNDGDNGFLSPLVKSIVKTENITQTELDAIQGSGREGRITKDDIMKFLEGGRKAPAKAVSSSAPAANKPVAKAPAPAVAMGSGDTIIEMDRMRKLIADHMVTSKHTSPHVTSFVEADVTNIVNWRNKIKNKFLAQEGEKITFTPIFIEAIAKAIREFPDINVAVKDGTHIIKKSNINIGMAAALPSGNLIVPVIKNADQLNLVGLTKAVNDLGKRAKANKLVPDEIQGGTYTMTNLGSFGNVFGTPIINQPQAAIMGVGAIVKKPAVITTEHGDVIAIRHFMMLSHAYDHRIVDGFLGGSFVKRVAELLESFDPNREI